VTIVVFSFLLYFKSSTKTN